MSKLLLLASFASVAFACSSDYAVWIPRSQSAEPLYRFFKDGKAGYIDATGRVVIPPTFKTLDGNGRAEFHDGLVEIGIFDGVYADRTGKVVLDKGLYRGWDFSEGLAVAMRKGENVWGYIDTTGEFVIPPQFATSPNGYVHPFSDGFALIEVKGLFGHIDKSGKFAIPPQFLDGAPFADGMARIVTEGPCSYNPEGGCGFANLVLPGTKEPPPYDPLGQARGEYPPCKFSFTDRAGHRLRQRFGSALILCPSGDTDLAHYQRFDYARDFSEGLAPVRIGDFWGFIDKTGAMAITPRFDDAGAFHDGLGRIKVNGMYGYTDKSGVTVISPQFKEADDFSDGLAPVGDGGDKHWYIDQHGRRAFDGDFSVASIFFKGLAHVRLRASDPASRKAVSPTSTQKAGSFSRIEETDRGLSPVTVEHRCHSVRPFLDQLLTELRSLDMISVVGYRCPSRAKDILHHAARSARPISSSSMPSPGRQLCDGHRLRARSNIEPRSIFWLQSPRPTCTDVGVE